MRLGIEGVRGKRGGEGGGGEDGKGYSITVCAPFCRAPHAGQFIRTNKLLSLPVDPSQPTTTVSASATTVGSSELKLTLTPPASATRFRLSSKLGWLSAELSPSST